MTNRILSKLPHEYINILQCTKMPDSRWLGCLEKTNGSVAIDLICYPCFCCTKYSIVSKNYLHQGENQHFIQKPERHPVVSEGIGWAGQPIVKRTHAILPEVYGDVSDIFTALNQLPISESTESKQGVDSTLEIKNNNVQNIKNSDSIDLPNSECLSHGTDSEFDKSLDQKVSQSCIKCHNNIALMNNCISSDKASANLAMAIPSEELKEPAINFHEQNKNKVRIDYLDLYEEELKPKKIKNSKLKMKRSKVLGVKTIKGVNKQKVVRKKKTKVYGPRRKYKLQPQLILCQRNKSHYVHSENVLLEENRQLMTDAALSYPKTSMVLNGNKSRDKNRANTFKKANKGKKETASDDCVCPEIIEDKQKETTKICGESAKGDEKEKKKRKQNMCIIEPIMKHRQKTYVCAPVVIKGKRKRQLPKCPEPEKKVAPRTEVCPPKLLEAKAAAEQCVKQVDVKIRKRSKVCKPVIIYAKEEASIKIEKTICTESRVKQTISKHTKVCPPSKNNVEKLSVNGSD